MFVSEFSLLISDYFRDNVITNVPSFVDKKRLRGWYKVSC